MQEETPPTSEHTTPPAADHGPSDSSRRNFLQGALATGAATLGGLTASSLAHAQTGLQRSTISHYHVPATAETVHWGYFSKNLKPLVEVQSGDFVTIETLTHHANDDAERMVKGDPGAESVFFWDKTRKGVNRRGAGPMDASLFGRGAGEGLGVHICTGPVAVAGARGGRRPRGAHSRRQAAAVRESAVQGQELRQQRRGLVGLSLQRP